MHVLVKIRRRIGLVHDFIWQAGQIVSLVTICNFGKLGQGILPFQAFLYLFSLCIALQAAIRKYKLQAASQAVHVFLAYGYGIAILLHRGILSENTDIAALKPIAEIVCILLIINQAEIVKLHAPVTVVRKAF